MTSQRTIVYGVMGEGRGHATRSLAIAERLAIRGYRVVVLTSGDAYPIFRQHPQYDLHPVLPFDFVYQGARVQQPRTAGHLLPGLWGLRTRTGGEYRRVRSLVAETAPLCVITDLEPYTARVAQELQIPLVAIDHQHTLLSRRTPSLNRRSALALSICRPFIRHIFRADETIAASFYHFEPRAGTRQTHHILRQEVVSLPAATVGEHVTVYLKRNIYFWDALRAALGQLPNQRFQVFSDFDQQQLAGGSGLAHVDLCGIDERRYVFSLKRCKALVCTAGNQTIGEAIYLKKPILAIPEPMAFEQEVNALALQQSGCGVTVSYDACTADAISEFLGQLGIYRQQLKKYLRARPHFDSTRYVTSRVEAVLATQQRKQQGAA